MSNAQQNTGSASGRKEIEVRCAGTGCANLSLDVSCSFATLTGSPLVETRKPFFPRLEPVKMKDQERRRLTRYNLRTPLRFRALGVGADTSEHFTEALNVSRVTLQ